MVKLLIYFAVLVSPIIGDTQQVPSVPSLQDYLYRGPINPFPIRFHVSIDECEIYECRTAVG